MRYGTLLFVVVLTTLLFIPTVNVVVIDFLFRVLLEGFDGIGFSADCQQVA